MHAKDYEMNLFFSLKICGQIKKVYSGRLGYIIMKLFYVLLAVAILDIILKYDHMCPGTNEKT